MNFNCTIQELKRLGFDTIPLDEKEFQLHHTGIKTGIFHSYVYFSGGFQLHHTGIKTNPVTESFSAMGGISIAPYRN